MGKNTKLVTYNPMAEFADDDDQDPSSSSYSNNSTDVEIILKPDRSVGAAPNHHPSMHASIASRMFFNWTIGLVNKARKPPKDAPGEKAELKIEDVWDPPPKCTTNNVADRLESKLIESNWDGSAGKLWRHILGLDKSTLLWMLALSLAQVAIQVAIPLLTNYLLEYIGTATLTEDFSLGISLAVSLTIIVFGYGVLSAHVEYLQEQCGTQWRSATSAIVFRKGLEFSTVQFQDTSIGKINTLIQSDSNAFANFANEMNYLWAAPLIIIGNLVVIYVLVGWSSIIGFGVLVISIPLSTQISKLSGKKRKKLAAFMDQRLEGTNELLQSVQGVKMGAWEAHFRGIIMSARKKEATVMLHVMWLFAVALVITAIVPALASTTSIVVFVLVQGDETELKASQLFTIIVAFNQILKPLSYVPGAVRTYYSTRVSVERLAEFLYNTAHVVKRPTGASPTPTPNSSPRTSLEIRVEDGQFSWNSDGSEPVLTDINLTIAPRTLTAVVGKVGSGKSSLCSALLGDCKKVRGEVSVDLPAAYCSQTAWIVNATVRDNILFGETFDSSRYNSVLKACELEYDLSLLPAGDLTEIGEKGINLSGGQRQRVSIARALYSTHGVVILDDPLSALDPGVADRVFHNAINGPMMTNRTRILVTNQLSFLKHCDSVVLLGEAQSKCFTVLSQGHLSELSTSASSKSDRGFAEVLRSVQEQPGTTATSDDQQLENTEEVPPVNDEENTKDQNESSDGEEIEDKLMTAEEKNAGSLRTSDIMYFLRSAGGMCTWMVVFFLLSFAQGIALINTSWISFWTNAEQANYIQNASTPFSDFGIDIPRENASQIYLYGYLVTSGLLALTFGLPLFVIFYIILKASTNLHNRLLERILYAPMSFFDTTPLGRILTRFGTDVSNTDVVSSSISQFCQALFAVLGSIVIISIVIPEFLAATPVIVVVFLYVLNLYRPVSREIRRIQSLAGSSVFAHANETFSGLSTIRAYGESPRFIKKNATKLDVYGGTKLAQVATRSWFYVRHNFVAVLVTGPTACLLVVLANQGVVSSGSAGLALTYALVFADQLENFLYMVASVEGRLVSVERIIFYVLNVPQEAPHVTKTTPPRGWPHTGEIQVKDLSLRYRPNTPLVLKNISFNIKGGERIGVVGRTGSGKSTLFQCLLRLVEPEKLSKQGPITIDGVDICAIGLRDLRSRITIVPQNPIVFSGTIRKNLDPTGLLKDPDSKMWQALERCRMKQFVSELPKKLDSEITDSGANLSQGQKQLLTLARAVLEQSRILLLDEATSSVDFETDRAIQETLRDDSAFPGCTVLTIAHRINTIIDSDRILVLDDGTIAEYDAPDTLLSDPGSILSDMVRKHEQR